MTLNNIRPSPSPGDYWQIVRRPGVLCLAEVVRLVEDSQRWEVRVITGPPRVTPLHLNRQSFVRELHPLEVLALQAQDD